MDSQSLILLQLELECVRLNRNGYLEAFQCDNADEIARLYCYKDAETYYLFLRQDMEPTLRQHLKLLRGERFFEEQEMIQRTLSEEAPCNSIFHGRTYIFPEEAMSQPYEDKEIIYGEASFCSLQLDGAVLASCSSVRENGKCAEAWVNTEEIYRGKGYGRRVALAWARRLREKGKIPFYSHAMTNIASQRLVSDLPFVWTYDLIAYS